MFAMDRGYLSFEMIDYISSTGCSIIGTHKRVKNNFGKGISQTANKKNDKRKVIEEVGAKMTYLAEKQDNGSGETYKALAYQSPGRGHVGTLLFTSDAEVGEEKFIYKLKKLLDSFNTTANTSSYE